MKKNWLRGILLGVSLALLLAGGVVLAQEISISTDPEGCIECSTGIDDIHHLGIVSSGWDGNEFITREFWQDEQYLGACGGCDQAAGGEFNDPAWLFFNPCPERVGNWRFKLTGDTSLRSGEFTILVAEDCFAAMFVPEPGSILLLGSGVAGLAGYATLRWRSRE